MPGGRGDEERVTAGDKCGGEQLIWKRKGHRRKKGGGVAGLIQAGSDQLDTGEHNISLDLDPTPIHWRGAPKGSVDEEPHLAPSFFEKVQIGRSGGPEF